MPVLLYIPNPHNGVLQFLERCSRENDTLWVVGSDLEKEFSSLHTEIRAVDPHKIKLMIEALGIFKDIQVLDHHNIQEFSTNKIITASESISHQVVAKYFPKAEVIYDTVFLRYDEANVLSQKPVCFDRESKDPFDVEMMRQAYDESEGSSCWWRHVGSVLVRDREVILKAHNQHVPSEHMPYVFGDPRDFIEAGKLSHFASTLHSEQMIFLDALKKGMCLDAYDLYGSVFSCPSCSKWIAYSGIKRYFFGSGHASLDGQEVLKSQGVELIYVPIQPRT